MPVPPTLHKHAVSPASPTSWQVLEYGHGTRHWHSWEPNANFDPLGHPSSTSVVVGICDVGEPLAVVVDVP